MPLCVVSGATATTRPNPRATSMAAASPSRRSRRRWSPISVVRPFFQNMSITKIAQAERKNNPVRFFAGERGRKPGLPNAVPCFAEAEDTNIFYAKLLRANRCSIFLFSCTFLCKKVPKNLCTVKMAASVFGCSLSGHGRLTLFEHPLRALTPSTNETPPFPQLVDGHFLRWMRPRISSTRVIASS